MSVGYKQFCKTQFSLGADYVQPQYDGIKGQNRILISAVAVNQKIPKVLAIWVKGKGTVYQVNKY